MNPYEPPSHLPWASRILLRVEVGSTAHGTGLPGQEDYDEMAIMADPYESMVGISNFEDTIVHRPGRAVGERSQAGDYDLVVHGARKFCRLATEGNPSILLALYGPVRASNKLGRSLREQHMLFHSQRARMRFLGYAKSQRERLLGIRGGAHTNRPELVEKFGYDTKYAMHMVRLGLQGIEYMQTGRIKLPIPDPHGELLRSIRNGDLKLGEVLELAEANEETLANHSNWAGVAPRPDVSGINAWLREVAEEYRVR